MNEDLPWMVNFSDAALADYDEIVERFRQRLELQPVMYSYPLARIGKRARHHLFVSFDIERGISIVNILRILHDRMDFGNHLPTNQS